MSVMHAARRLAEHQPSHPVVSLYLDLDPEEFAAPPARVSQINSLLDQAARDVEADDSLTHEELVAVREDLDRVRDYLLSDEPPFQGARALAVFCAGHDDLFEVVQLSRPAPPQVAVERTPYVEPLIAGAHERRWCVALVSRREARILTGTADRLSELRHFEDGVHGQHQQGGWSQARYERSYEKEADDHLRHVAEMLERRRRAQPYDRLALGGPAEVASRLHGFLSDAVRSALTEHRVEVDLSTATDDDIRHAVSTLVEEDERAREREALDRMAEGIGAGGRGAGGAEDVIAALGERRVQTLLLDQEFDGAAGRCPNCGLLGLQESGECPTGDGSTLEPVEHLREAAIELALAQDAEVIVVTRFPDLGPFRGIGAVLRF